MQPAHEKSFTLLHASRLFWIDFLHTSYAQTTIMPLLFYYAFAASGFVRNNYKKCRMQYYSGEEARSSGMCFDVAWKSWVAEMYFEEDLVRTSSIHKNSPQKSVSRLELVLAEWTRNLLYLQSTLEELKIKEHERYVEEGRFGIFKNPARKFNHWRRAELSFRLNDKIARVESDIGLLSDVVKKLDERFEVTIKQKESGSRQRNIQASLVGMGFAEQVVTSKSEAIQAIAGLLWLEEDSPTGSYQAPTSDPEAAIMRAQAKAKMEEEFDKMAEDMAKVSEEDAGASSSWSPPADDAPGILPSTTPGWLVSEPEKIDPKLAHISISKRERQILDSASVTTSWRRWGPSFLKLTAYLILQFLVVPML